MSAPGRVEAIEGNPHLELRLLAPVFSTVFVGMLWWIGFRPFISQAAANIGASVPIVGQVITMGALVTALAGLFTGPVADHYGHRRSIMVGLGFLSAGSAVIALSPHVLLLAVGGVVGGLGMAMTYGVAFGVVSTHFDGSSRSRALGMTQAAASIAVVVGVPALIMVASVIQWRGSFLVLAVAFLFALALVSKLLPSDPPTTGRCASPRRILANYRPLIAIAPMRVLYFASMLRSVAATGLAVYLGAFYFDVLDFSNREASMAFMLEGAGLAIGNVAGGGRLGGFNPRRTFGVGTSMIGIGAVAIYSLQPGPLPTVAIAMVMAFVTGVTFTSLTTLLAQETPIGAATTMVLNISTIAIGAALGSAIGGVLLEVGSFRLIGVASLLVALAAAALVHAPLPSTTTQDTTIGTAVPENGV